MWFLIALAAFITFIYTILTYPQPELDLEALHTVVQQYVKRCSDAGSLSVQNSNRKDLPLTGVRILITGPTSGIGMALAKQLYALGATIIAIGRSPKRLASLQSDVEKQHQEKANPKQKRFFCYTADFADLETVNAACNQIQSDFSSSHIDFIVNNAGIPNLFDENGGMLRSKQNYELVLAVNYLSHYLLTSKLMPLLEKSEKFPRVIYVASNFHRGVTGDALLTNIRDPISLKTSYQPVASGNNFFKLPTPMHAYANSKFAQLLHVRSLNRKHEEQADNSKSPLPMNKQVHSIAVCPGAVRTSIHKGKKNLVASFTFPADLSTSCLFHALFSPPSRNIDYVKNLPSLSWMDPPNFLSEELRFKFLFVMGVISIPIQKFMFSRDMYYENSDDATYDLWRQDDLEKWTRKELATWL